MREYKFRAWIDNRMIYFANVDTCSEYNTLTFDWIEDNKSVPKSWEDNGNIYENPELIEMTCSSKLKDSPEQDSARHGNQKRGEV